MTSRRFIVLCVLAAAVILGWFGWGKFAPPESAKEAAAPVINKQPVNFAGRTFDPASPPPDMPALSPGEAAECDTNFQADAVVGGEAENTDATHALVTVTRVTVNLGLDITIWAPAGATQRVMEHENGHRQISEHYYQTAETIAARIAAPYLGKQVLVSGADLRAELRKALQQMGAEITDEYYRTLNPEPAQLRYDDITDHSRNDAAVADAIAQALREATVASTPGAAGPGN